MPRQLIVVDTETTGLSEYATIVEVAAINLDTGQEFYFVPNIEDVKLSVKDLFALKLNGYVERELWKQQLTPNQTLEHYAMLGAMLEGNTFGGSNPAFDQRVLSKKVNTTWHHRLGDLATYAAKPMGRDITDLPGLSDVAEFFELPIPGRHGALEDARATAALFQKIRAL
jgi:DNA polymerase-3 subunit epsilon